MDIVGVDVLDDPFAPLRCLYAGGEYPPPYNTAVTMR